MHNTIVKSRNKLLNQEKKYRKTKIINTDENEKPSESVDLDLNNEKKFAYFK